MPRKSSEPLDTAGEPSESRPHDGNGVPDRRKRPGEDSGARSGQAPVFEKTLRRIMNEIRADGRDGGENALDEATDVARHGDVER